jgi:4-hydroxy-2-oxoheptanedioate aldolase
MAVEACHYPPLGNRSMGPVRHHLPPDRRPEPLCFVMIETAEGLQNLDAIAATPGLDGLYFGPVDLALAMGEALSSAMAISDRTLAAMDAVIAACARNGLIPGTAAVGRADGRLLMDRGMRLITTGIDILHLRAGAAADVARVRIWHSEGSNA